MDTKKVAILAAVFIILGILYYIVEDPGGSKQKKEPESFIPNFSRESVARIELNSRENTPVVLQKDRQGWIVTADNSTYRADSDPVDKLFENLETLTWTTVASRNPDKFTLYEVTPDTGVEVRIEDASGGTPAHFIVGKSGPDIFSTYIRKQDSDRVILCDGILKNVYDKPLKDWRDKQLFDLKHETIVEYRISGDRELHLRKSDNGTWQMRAPEEMTPDAKAAEEAVKQFAGLSCVDFSTDNDTKTGLSEPSRILTAVLGDGAEKTLMVGKEKNTYQHYARTKGGDEVYVIENHKLETCSPLPETLKPKVDEQKKPAQDNQTAGAPETKK